MINCPRNSTLYHHNKATNVRVSPSDHQQPECQGGCLTVSPLPCYPQHILTVIVTQRMPGRETGTQDYQCISGYTWMLSLA